MIMQKRKINCPLRRRGADKLTKRNKNCVLSKREEVLRES